MGERIHRDRAVRASTSTETRIVFVAKVLLTGACGYIGAILCEHLLNAGHHLTVVDYLAYGGHSLFHLASNPNFEFVYGDARNESLMRSLVKGADVVIPLAALVGA